MTTQTEPNKATETKAVATTPRPTTLPRYGVAENENAFVVTAYVPGVAPVDIETLLNGDNLVVNARRTWSAPEGWTLVHREMAQADYRLVLKLDRRIDREGVKAQLTQGVLTLTLPKAAELKPRKIEIAG